MIDMSDSFSFRNVQKVTTHVLQEMKLNQVKIAMLTAYDYSFARILEDTGIDVILVGDSASNVMAGHTSTLPITLNEMIYHASSVVRAVMVGFNSRLRPGETPLKPLIFRYWQTRQVLPRS